MRTYLLVLVLFGAVACTQEPKPPLPVRTGLDRLAAGEVPILNGKTVGIITNQTGVTRTGRHIADIVQQDPNIRLAALFGPEHGIRGKAEGGYAVSGQTDPETGVPIYSLYGATRRPEPAALDGLDALVFDIQDIGARFYTYISTMAYAMQAAADHGLEFVVLDRPNPIGGDMVEGPVLDPEFRSFIGIHPIAMRHGMTVGELARMFNEEGWLGEGRRVNLRVVQCEGWERRMIFRDYGDTWVPPSPNIPDAETAIIYSGMGLIETIRSFSEGRGTDSPFLLVGAPWLDSERVIRDLEGFGLEGVRFEPESFTPRDMPGRATRNKYDSRLCNGIRFRIDDGHELPAVRLAMHLLASLVRHHSDSLVFNERRANSFYGQSWVLPALSSGTHADSIIAQWQPDLDSFVSLRKSYLTYPDQ